jgi:hypothetical protein
MALSNIIAASVVRSTQCVCQLASDKLSACELADLSVFYKPSLKEFLFYSHYYERVAQFYCPTAFVHYVS